MIKQATVGRILHYTLGPNDVGDRASSVGQIRPAIILRVWENEFQSEPGSGGPYDAPGYNVQVFVDGTNDGHDPKQGTLWRTSVRVAAEPTPGCLHWPQISEVTK